MKIKLTTTIEIDKKKYPNLTKSIIRTQVDGGFDLLMQQLEEETANLLADMNIEAKRK